MFTDYSTSAHEFEEYTVAMKNSHLLLLGCGVTGSLLFVGLARAQDVQAIIGNVFLQDSTPGTVQGGHANIGGTFRAGQVVVNTTNSGTIPIIGNNNSTNPGAVGGSFSVFGQGATALRGTATNNGGAGVGVLGASTGAKGVGVSGSGFYGGEFLTVSDYGAAIHVGSTTSARRGILGEASSSSSFSPPALFTQSGSASPITGLSKGFGAIFNSYAGSFGSLTFGDAAVNGIDQRQSGLGIGVFGRTKSPNGYGVQGQGDGTGANVAVHGTGNITATGTKSFVIDHPLDPQNKVLYHYCAEGPEPYNVYRGNVTLDAKGEAWVQLPGYYESINTDPVYQLTPIGGQASLFVASKVNGNRFKIGGGRQGLEASWVVTARRNDAYVRHYGVTKVKDKPMEERGTYLSPEAYGLPQARGSDAIRGGTEDADGTIVRGDGKVLREKQSRP